MDIVDKIKNFKEIITNDGKKYSDYKINRSGIIINKNNIKMAPYNNGGYDTYTILSDGKISKHFSLHRLLAMTFIKNPNNYEVVNHIDENKSNNNIKNLEWCTVFQNTVHSCGKKVNQIDIDTNKVIKTFNSISDANKELNKHKNSPDIGMVCNKDNKRKTAHGHKWEFV